MFGALVEVHDFDGAAFRQRRKSLGLSQREAARRMFAHLRGVSFTSDEEIAVASGWCWSTERACLRAVSEIERESRVFKDGQYVEALLSVLGFDAPPTRQGPR